MARRKIGLNKVSIQRVLLLSDFYKMLIFLKGFLIPLRVILNVAKLAFIIKSNLAGLPYLL